MAEHGETRDRRTDSAPGEEGGEGLRADVLGYVVGARLALTVGWSRALHDEATAASFATGLRTTLEHLAEMATSRRS